MIILRNSGTMLQGVLPDYLESKGMVEGQWSGIKGMTEQQPGTLKIYRKSFGGI